jgi:spermidine/putrescine-binding protein
MKYIDESFLNPVYDETNEYSVPYMWGTLGILYNKKMVKEPVDSWDILWNPKYKGNIMMFDSVRDTMGVGLKKLGYSINSTDPKQINEAKNALSICKMELVKQTSVEPSINLFFKKTSSIPSNYPRNYGQIKKKPL